MKAAPAGAMPLRPVASEKTRSPSAGVWVGQMERAKPSCAAIASRLAAAAPSAASVAITPIVVFCRASPSKDFSLMARASRGIGEG